MIGGRTGVIAAGAGVAVVVIVAAAAFMGRGKSHAPQESAAPVAAAPATDTPAEAAQAAQESAAGAPTPTPTPTPEQAPAPAAPAALPAAFALDAPVHPGAVEIVQYTAKNGSPTELARPQIEGQALATVAFAATRAQAGSAGWGDDGDLRVTRVGLLRVDAAGPVAVMLTDQTAQKWPRRSRCELAIGDPANIVLQERGEEQATTVALMPGWHRVYLAAVGEGAFGRDSRCQLSIKPSDAAAPLVPALYQPGA